jgi:hypothetical protein
MANRRGKAYEVVTVDPIDSPNNQAKRCTCFAVSNTCFRWLTGLLILVALAAIIVILILAWNQTNAVLAAERFCGEISGLDGSTLNYMVSMDTNSRNAPVSWSFQLLNTNDTNILTAGVYGPIVAPSATGSLFFALCGAPSSLACTIAGSISMTDPGGAGLNGYTVQLRGYPIVYYLQVEMALGTVYRNFFTQSCGRPAG